MVGNITKNVNSKRGRKESVTPSRQKYKAAGLTEVRVWVPEGSEFLLEILAAQLRDGQFSRRPTEKQVEYAVEIQKELSEPIPDEAILSKQAMSKWIKDQKSHVYDSRKVSEKDLEKELVMLGLDMSRGKWGNRQAEGRSKKNTRR